MRTPRVLLAAALLLAIAASAARAATSSGKPRLVRLHWHLVADGVTNVNATDRYLVYETSAGLTVVDRQTEAVTELPASACPAPEELGPLLGGPWVAECADFQGRQLEVQLYDIVRQQWVAVPGITCFPCATVAVGAHWIEILAYECQEHCAPQASLENIFSGEIEPDPVSPNVDFREDLDSPTGTSPLCPPLHYPAWFDRGSDQLEPAGFTMLDNFALTGLGNGNHVLERCHSNWHKRLIGEALGDAEMVLWSAEYWGYGTSTVHGLLLPSLRRFNFTVPSRFDPRQSGLPAVALSGRTIFVLTRSGALRAARVPQIR